MASGLPWIRAYTSIRTDPRSLVLGRMLGDSHAYIRIMDLRLWLADNAPDGRVPGPHAEVVVEEAVGWRGEPGAFARAALESGFLRAAPVRDSSGISLEDVDWAEEQASHVAKIERDRKKPDGRQKSRAAPVRDSSGESRELRVESREEDPPNPPGGEGVRSDPPERERPASAPVPRGEASPDLLPFEAGPELEPSGSSAWTLPDAVDAVYREVFPEREAGYVWHQVEDERAATALLSLCAAEGVPIHRAPEEIARRFGRALVRSLNQYAPGKAVVLKQLAVRATWRINAERPVIQREAPDPLSGQRRKVEIQVDPWEAMIEKREAA